MAADDAPAGGGRKPDLAGLRIAGGDRGAGRSRAWLLLLAAACVAAFLARKPLLGLFRSLGAPEVTIVQVQAVAAGAAPAGALTANGYVVAQRQAALAPKTAGKLEELLVVEGSRVTAGQVLARLEHRDVDAQLLRARAEVAQAEATLDRQRAAVDQGRAEQAEAGELAEASRAAREQAEAAFVDAEREADRARRLLADGSGTRAEAERADAQLAIARARVTETKAREASAQSRASSLAAQLRGGEAAVRSATAAADARRADVALLDAQLEYLTIRAPFDGVVIRKEAEVGEIVAPIAGGAQSRVAVLTVVDMASLMVEADVSEAYIRRIEPGKRANITLDSLPETVYPGRVAQIVPTADRTKATVEVKVACDAPDDRIVPEMGAKVFFLEGDAPEGEAAGATRLFLPEDALQGGGGAPFVWLVRAGRVERRSVVAGERARGRVEILGGLKASDRVVAGDAAALEEGMAVREAQVR